MHFTAKNNAGISLSTYGYMVPQTNMFGKICGVYMKVIIDSGEYMEVTLKHKNHSYADEK